MKRQQHTRNITFSVSLSAASLLHYKLSERKIEWIEKQRGELGLRCSEYLGRLVKLKWVRQKWFHPTHPLYTKHYSHFLQNQHNALYVFNFMNFLLCLDLTTTKTSMHGYTTLPWLCEISMQPCLTSLRVTSLIWTRPSPLPPKIVYNESRS